MPFLSPIACATAWPSVMPTSSTVWWSSICVSPCASTSRSIRPCRAIWSSMWSRNGTPVASFCSPEPSRLSFTLICVSLVLRTTCATRMAISFKQPVTGEWGNEASDFLLEHELQGSEQLRVLFGGPDGQAHTIRQQWVHFTHVFDQDPCRQQRIEYRGRIGHAY